jgi:hypothetical protein
MTLKHVHRDDVVEVDIKGRRFRADVEDVDGSVLRIRPLSRNISYRHASARQIVRHCDWPVDRAGQTGAAVRPAR